MCVLSNLTLTVYCLRKHDTIIIKILKKMKIELASRNGKYLLSSKQMVVSTCMNEPKIHETRFWPCESSWNVYIVLRPESALQIKDLTYGTILIQFHLPSFSSSSTRAIRNQTPQLKTVAGHLSQCLWFLMSNSRYYFHRPNKQQSNYTSEHIRSRYALRSLNNITSPIYGKADSASPRWQP